MKKIIFISICWLTACTTAQHKEAVSRLPYYNTADFTPLWLTKKESDTVHTVPAFTFTDQDGHYVTSKTFDDKITVVDFFFTSCPGICKRLTTNLTSVQEAFKNDSDVLLLSHSVTPDYDSVPVLKKYATTFHAIEGKWHFVTGDKDAVYNIARKGYFADEDLGLQKSSNDFLHTENVLLVDGNHHIRGVYKGTDPAAIKELISDITELKKEL